MNTYEVAYKEYNNDRAILVVAATVLAAYKAGRICIRKKCYGDKEILSVRKINAIDAMGKD
jgi:hypothetical protein